MLRRVAEPDPAARAVLPGKSDLDGEVGFEQDTGRIAAEWNFGESIYDQKVSQVLFCHPSFLSSCIFKLSRIVHVKS